MQGPNFTKESTECQPIRWCEMFRFQPGCCCGGCLAFADNFNRADSSTVGNDWTEAAGDWSINSNAVRVSSSSASLSHATALTTGAYDATFRFRSSSDGDELSFSDGVTTITVAIGTGASVTVGAVV